MARKVRYCENFLCMNHLQRGDKKICRRCQHKEALIEARIEMAKSMDKVNMKSTGSEKVDHAIRRAKHGIAER